MHHREDIFQIHFWFLPLIREAFTKCQCIIEEDIFKIHFWFQNKSDFIKHLFDFVASGRTTNLPLNKKALNPKGSPCIIEEGSQTDSAIANGDPSTGARRLELDVPTLGSEAFLKEHQCVIGEG